MGYKHFLQHDIKSHPLDKVELGSPHLSVSSFLSKGPFSVDKVAQVQSMNCLHNLCPVMYTDKKEECLSKLGDKAIDDELHQPMASHLVTQSSIDPSPTNAQSLASYDQAYTDHHYC